MNRTWSIPAMFVALAAIFMRFPGYAPPAGNAKTTAAPGAPAVNMANTPATGGTSVKKAASARSGQTSDVNVIEGPWLATRRFYRSPDEPEALTAANVPLDLSVTSDIQAWSAANPGKVASLFGIEPGKENQITWLTAIVPDPLHTRLPLFTDSSIGAILQAATALHWEFAGQWMPWYDAVNDDEKDPEKRRSQRDDVRIQEKQPGILVFRYFDQDANPRSFGDRVLLIFLVGETPTSGVNPDQFLNARAYMNALHKPANVLIQGPTFTGSLYSLAKLIDQDPQSHSGLVRYSVRSGTLTSRYHKEAFLHSNGYISFSGATLGSEDQEVGLEQIATALGIDHSQTAILVEDDSAFGAAVRKEYNPDKQFRVFQFPRDISHLRNVYRDAEQVGTSPGKSPVPEVDFSLKDPQTGEDSTPTFSASHTPLSQDAIVNQVASAICRDRMRLVELNATNVLDAIFLAKLLKHQCEDARVLLTAPDLLFVEAARTESLNGTLALSTYPLFHHSGDGDHALLSDANSLGVYNSTILSLAEAAPLGGNREGLTHLIDYGLDKTALPPVWLLTLDRQGFVPVGIGTQGLSHQLVEPGSLRGTYHNFIQPLPPPVWTALTSFACLALLALCVATWWVSVDRRATFCASMSWRLPPGEISKPDVWRVFYASTLLALFATFAILLVPPLSEKTRVAVACIAGVAVCGAGLLLKMLLTLFNEHSTHPKWDIRSMLLALLVVLAALAALCIYWHCITFHLDYQKEFFHLRALELRLGSSPLWPVLASILALILFCYSQKVRMDLAVREAPDVYTPHTGTLSTHLKWAAKQLELCLAKAYRPCSERHLMPLFCCLVVCILASWIVDLPQQLSTIDGGGFSSLLLILVCIVIATLLLTCWQVFTLWTLLRHFLSALEPLPFIDAFSRPERAGDRRPIWIRWLNLESLDVYYRTAAILHEASIRLGPRDRQRHIDAYLRIYRGGLRLLLDPERTRDNALQAARILRRLNYTITTEVFASAMKHWGTTALLRATSAKPAEKAASPSTVDLPLYTVQGNTELGIDLMHSLLALHYTPYILYVVRQIQNLMWYIPAAFVLLTFSLTSYGLQSPQFIGRFLLLLFVFIFFVLWRCMSGMERDLILSRIAGTVEGELDTGFYLKFLGYGALPAISLLASQFPAISNFLFSWVEPTVKALN